MTDKPKSDNPKSEASQESGNEKYLPGAVLYLAGSGGLVIFFLVLSNFTEGDFAVKGMAFSLVALLLSLIGVVWASSHDMSVKRERDRRKGIDRKRKGRG